MSLINKKLFGSDGFGFRTGPSFQSVLKQKFVIPPFTVWNARDGDWQDRKRRWIKLGIQSEIGREDVQVYSGVKGMSSYCSASKMTQTSVFDPVICELCYTWFCPPGGTIVDPFAGGSVRGIVASSLGFQYWGCDLSKKQIEANRVQVNDRNTGEQKPKWVHGDSFEKLIDAPRCDLIFSCPPYGDLEIYSKDKRDISNMEYGDFLDRYGEIIERACKRLRRNRFACFTVANFRDKKTGLIRDFVGDTIKKFETCGLGLYNEVILVHPCGSAPVRTNNTFVKGNGKLVKLHQNILIFVKGEPKTNWEENHQKEENQS